MCSLKETFGRIADVTKSIIRDAWFAFKFNILHITRSDSLIMLNNTNLCDVDLELGLGNELYINILKERKDSEDFKNSKNPILLIHGSGASHAEWLVCKKYITKALHKHDIYAFSMTNNRVPSKMDNHVIEEFTNRTIPNLEKIYHKYNKSVILIGHSMGGLVAVDLLREYSDMIKSIITISSPLQGAPLLTKFPFNKLCNSNRHKQMTPESIFIKKMHNLAMNTSVKILCYGSANDIHVPSAYAQFPVDIMHNKKYDKMVISGYGHGSIIDNGEIWNNIMLWLDMIG